MKKLLVITLLLLTASTGFAQQNITFYNMRAVDQSYYLNPSRMPDNKMNIGIPVLSNTYFNISNSGFSYNDIITENGDTADIDFDRFLNSLEKTNYLNFSFQTDVFTIGKRIGERNYVNFSAAIKGSFNLRYSKDPFELVIKGNGPFIGKTKELDFALNSSTYLEYGFGLTRELIKDRFTAGARVKLLNGLVHASSDKTQATLFTDTTNYALKLTSDIVINTSIDDDEGPLNAFGKNMGAALDLGATYKLNEQIEFSASILDLGFIRWSHAVKNYKSKNPGATVEFEGIDFDDFFNDSTEFEEALEQLSDTFEERFDLVEDSAAFTQTLPMQLYLGANYNINNTTNVGFVYYHQMLKGKIIPGFGLSVNKRFGKIVGVYGSYSYYNRNATNVGLGFHLNLGPVQLYSVTDNVLAVTNWRSAQNTNFRLMMNLRFGHTDDKSKRQERKLKRKGQLPDENLNH